MNAFHPASKARLLQALRARVDSDLQTITRRQRDVQEGATHEESRSEHAKDTRATEQSYLARGLAERVQALERTRDALATFAPVEFAADAAIAISALVTLRPLDERPGAGEAPLQHWWIVPLAGGLELVSDTGSEFGDLPIRTLTPVSPMGRALIGLSVGDQAVVATPRGERHFEIVACR